VSTPNLFSTMIEIVCRISGNGKTRIPGEELRATLQAYAGLPVASVSYDDAENHEKLGKSIHCGAKLTIAKGRVNRLFSEFLAFQEPCGPKKRDYAPFRGPPS
jgi:hypothetical protein